MKKIVASSPFIKEPASTPARVILVQAGEGDQARFHTHIETSEGDCFWGHYFLSDFEAAYADWMKRCQEAFDRFKVGNQCRPGEFALSPMEEVT